MNQGIIQNAKMSKSGKTLRILVNDQWYSTNNFALQQAIGRNVQFDVGTSEYQGNVIYWANDAELVNDVSRETPQNPAQHAPQIQGRPAGEAAQRPKMSVPSPDAMAFMPFVSNTVAHAIQAGAIKSPEDIYAWAQKAFNTAKNLVEGRQQPEPVASDDFDDDIPF